MGRYTKRSFQLGPYWLGQRSGSPSWYRCWLEGKRTRRVSLGTTSFEQAQQALTDWYVVNRKPENETPAELTIAEVIGRYWEGHASKLPRAATVNTHCRYWLDYFKDKPVSEACSFSQQEAFKASLRARGLKDISINHVTSTGRAALRLAWKTGVIASVPPLTMLKVGEQPPMGRPVTPQEAARLLGELPEHAWLVNVLLIGTCARPSAIMQLDWSQIDFEAGLIRLNAEGRAQNKKRRPVVRMPSFLREVLQPIRQEKGPVVAFGGEAVKSVRTAWRKARERAGLDKTVTLYSWRHTLARWMRAQGVPQWEVQGQLGHRVAGVTERYAEYAPDYQVKATEAIELFYSKVMEAGAAGGGRTHDLSLTRRVLLPTELPQQSSYAPPYEISATFTIDWEPHPADYKPAVQIQFSSAPNGIDKN